MHHNIQALRRKIATRARPSTLTSKMITGKHPAFDLDIRAIYNKYDKRLFLQYHYTSMQITTTRHKVGNLVNLCIGWCIVRSAYLVLALPRGNNSRIFLRRTCLHFAATVGDLSMIEDLLSCEADPKALENRGQRPLHYAAMHNKTPG